MVNFRVEDLDAMLAQLRAIGAKVDADVQNTRGCPPWLGDRSRGQPIRALAARAALDPEGRGAPRVHERALRVFQSCRPAGGIKDGGQRTTPRRRSAQIERW